LGEGHPCLTRSGTGRPIEGVYGLWTRNDTRELAAITANPRAHYVNVHTVMWPAGEVRGQLK